jgi:tetratricopeptide (TPR) repeat protein
MWKLKFEYQNHQAQPVACRLGGDRSIHRHRTTLTVKKHEADVNVYPSVTTIRRIQHAASVILVFCLLALALPQEATAAEQAEHDKLPLGASRILYKAQQQFNRTAYRECCQILETYLQTHPDERYRQFYLLQGNSYFKMDAFKNAAKAYRKGLKIAPRDPMISLNLALALEKNGHKQSAAEQYIKAYKLQPKADPQLLYQAASLLTGTEHFRRAADLLNQLEREHAPARSEWLELLLYNDYRLQDYPAAIRVTERLLARQPEKVDDWQQLAQLRLHDKQYLGAAAAYEVLYRLREPSRQELEQLTELYQYLNLPLRAARTLERIVSGNRTRTDLERLAEFYRRGGLPREAGRCLTRIVEQWPDAKAYQLKAELLYEQSAYEQTLRLLETACKKFPGHAELHLQKGFAAWQLQDWSLAAESFKKARQFERTRISADAALEIIEVLRTKPASSLQTAFPSPPLTVGIR